MSSKPTYHSPSRVDYDDLIEVPERLLASMKKSYPGMVLQNKLSSWTAHHNIAAMEKVLALMKKYKRNPQIDLFQEFAKLSK